MEQLIQQLIKELKQRNHLFYLIPKHTVKLSLKCSDESYQIILQRDGVTYNNSATEIESDISITGAKDSLIDLLCGNIKLQQALKGQKIKVSGTYRLVLLVESIFLLCRPYKIIQNIN